METPRPDNDPEQVESADSQEKTQPVVREKRDVKERAKEIGIGTAKALGYLALLGASTYGMYESVKTGDFNNVLPPGWKNLSDGDLLYKSFETSIGLTTLSPMTYKAGRWAVNKIKPATRSDEAEPGAKLKYEITDPNGREL